MAECAECGFDWDATGAEAIDSIRAAVGRLPALADHLRDALRRRPEPAVWSALEYMAHVRDALSFYDDRVRRVLTEERPRLGAFGFDAACEERRYNDEDPPETLAGLERAGAALVARLGSLGDADWSRLGIGSEGGERTVLVLARRAAHEAVHHLMDVQRVLDRPRAGRFPVAPEALG